MSPYRPLFSVYTATEDLRFHPAWTPMSLHEARDGKLVSGHASTRVYPTGRKYLKRLHLGPYGTWRFIRDRHIEKARRRDTLLDM